MEQEKEYISEQEARTVKELFRKYLQDYKQKPADMTDKEWLVQLFQKELPETTPEQAEKDAIEITESISEFDENLASVNEAANMAFPKKIGWLIRFSRHLWVYLLWSMARHFKNLTIIWLSKMQNFMMP